jgi:phage FluMu gp28-like protein
MVYQADRNAGGHADRATSLMLAGRAYSRCANDVGFFPMTWDAIGP